MKRKLLILSILAICLATVAAGSLAYFTAEDTAHNVITTGGVAIELREWADDEKTTPFEDLDGILPGAAATKIVEIENTGEAEAWIRVKIKKDIALIQPGTPDNGLVELDLNTADWTAGKDGYFYCNAPVAPGDVTAPLFTTVSFNVTMGNEYQNATASVNIFAQAVQTANNGETVFNATGWPAIAE